MCLFMWWPTAGGLKPSQNSCATLSVRWPYEEVKDVIFTILSVSLAISVFFLVGKIVLGKTSPEFKYVA